MANNGEQQVVEILADKLDSLHRQQQEQGKKLDTIQTTLQQIAVQDEQIRNIQAEQRTMWAKMDSLFDPNTGALTKVQSHQASCPREQVKFLWIVTIPMGLTLIGLGIKLLAGGA